MNPAHDKSPLPVAADYDAAVELYAALAEQERRVLRLLLSNRRVSRPIALAAGLTVDHFAQDDHRLAFATWQVACEDGLPDVRVLGLLCLAMRAAGLWDESAPADSTGMFHNDKTLAALVVPGFDPEAIIDTLRGGDGDGLRRAIARNVVALVDAAEAAKGAA